MKSSISTPQQAEQAAGSLFVTKEKQGCLCPVQPKLSPASSAKRSLLQRVLLHKNNNKHTINSEDETRSLSPLERAMQKRGYINNNSEKAQRKSSVQNKQVQRSNRCKKTTKFAGTKQQQHDHPSLAGECTSSSDRTTDEILYPLPLKYCFHDRKDKGTVVMSSTMRLAHKVDSNSKQNKKQEEFIIKPVQAETNEVQERCFKASNKKNDNHDDPVEELMMDLASHKKRAKSLAAKLVASANKVSRLERKNNELQQLLRRREERNNSSSSLLLNNEKEEEELVAFRANAQLELAQKDVQLQKVNQQLDQEKLRVQAALKECEDSHAAEERAQSYANRLEKELVQVVVSAFERSQKAALEKLATTTSDDRSERKLALAKAELTQLRAAVQQKDERIKSLSYHIELINKERTITSRKCDDSSLSASSSCSSTCSSSTYDSDTRLEYLENSTAASSSYSSPCLDMSEHSISSILMRVAPGS